MENKFYGIVESIKETSAVFAQGVSKNAQDKGVKYIICLGKNEKGIKVGDRIAALGGKVNQGVLYPDELRVYDDKKKQSQSKDSGGYYDATFNMSVGNAVNVYRELYGEDAEVDNQLVYEIYTKASKIKEYFSNNLGLHIKDSGAKVGAALLQAAKCKGVSLEDDSLFKKAQDIVKTQIEVEKYIREKEGL